jgi:hypothetical protein
VKGSGRAEGEGALLVGSGARQSYPALLLFLAVMAAGCVIVAARGEEG